jgi:hypothetical protein
MRSEISGILNLFGCVPPGVPKHGLGHGLLGVMFTLLLDLYQASRSCHEVLDELYPEVLISTLNSFINTKLQNQHAQLNLLYQGG